MTLELQPKQAFVRVETETVLRAVAIAFVVCNHGLVQWWFPGGWGGGMNFLMLLSGYNFARFSVHQRTDPAEVQRGIRSLAWQLFLPSLLMILFCFLLRWKFDVRELLFIKNWQTTGRVALFPTWYVQVILQIFAFFCLVLQVRPLGRAILRHPLPSFLLLWCGALAAYLAHQTIRAHHGLNLPHLWLWNFALGGAVFYCVIEREIPRRVSQGVASAIVAASAIGVYDATILRFWTIVVGGLLLIWVEKVPLPRLLANAVRVVGQASFAIFLWHRLLFFQYKKWLGNDFGTPLLMVVVCVTVIILGSVLTTAVARAWRIAARLSGARAFSAAAPHFRLPLRRSP